MRTSIYGGYMTVGAARKRRRRVHSVIGGRRRRTMRGHGFFGDLWSGVKSVASRAADVAPALWRSGLISKGLSMVPVVGAPAAGVVKALGGRRRRRRVVRKTYPMALGARRKRRVGARRRRRHVGGITIGLADLMHRPRRTIAGMRRRRRRLLA